MFDVTVQAGQRECSADLCYRGIYQLSELDKELVLKEHCTDESENVGFLRYHWTQLSHLVLTFL